MSAIPLYTDENSATSRGVGGNAKPSAPGMMGLSKPAAASAVGDLGKQAVLRRNVTAPGRQVLGDVSNRAAPAPQAPGLVKKPSVRPGIPLLSSAPVQVSNFHFAFFIISEGFGARAVPGWASAGLAAPSPQGFAPAGRATTCPSARAKPPSHAQPQFPSHVQCLDIFFSTCTARQFILRLTSRPLLLLLQIAAPTVVVSAAPPGTYRQFGATTALSSAIPVATAAPAQARQPLQSFGAIAAAAAEAASAAASHQSSVYSGLAARAVPSMGPAAAPAPAPASSSASSSAMTDEDVRRISLAESEIRASAAAAAAAASSATAATEMQHGAASQHHFTGFEDAGFLRVDGEKGDSAEQGAEGLSAADRANPQMVAPYVDDIMAHLRACEAKRQPSASYMSRQTDINAKMREILIDWLVEVHRKFKLRAETLFLTVNIIDRFLERRAVSRNKLQLVGCTAMLLASKYEEIYSPEVNDFVYVSDRAYTREQILAMETIILNALEFNLTVPYSLRFAERFTPLASDSEQFRQMVNYLVELTLQDYRFLRYMPSAIAASAVSLALHLSGNQAWTPVLQRVSCYSEGDLRACVMDLWHLAAANPQKCRAVRTKYSSPTYHQVARITIDAPAEQADS